MEKLKKVIDINATCPHCEVNNDYLIHVDEDGKLICKNCEKEFNCELWIKDIYVKCSKTKINKPIQLNDSEINIEKLKKTCQEYINFVADRERYYEDNDYEHSIFERAMETIFGKEVWEFINFME